MTKWLSNKWNLIGIYTLCSFCIGYILYDIINLTELLIISSLISVMSSVIYVFGVSRGMVMATVMRQEIDGFLEGFKKRMNEKKK